MNNSIKNKFPSIIKTILITIISLLFISVIPLVSYGDIGDGDSKNTKDTTITLVNPLGDNVNDLPGFIFIILELVFEIGAVVSVLAIIYVGFMFVKARGNSEELATARVALLYTVIGIAVLLGAVLIATVIDSTITDLSTGI